VDFINPLFAELGLDVENRRGHPEAYREVAYEDRVKVGGGTKVLRGGYVRFLTQCIEQLPIRTLDFSGPEDVERHEWMVGLVERMLSLHERLAGARIERERALIGVEVRTPFHVFLLLFGSLN